MTVSSYASYPVPRSFFVTRLCLCLFPCPDCNAGGITLGKWRGVWVTINGEYRCLGWTYDAYVPICLGVRGVGWGVTSHASTPAALTVFFSLPCVLRRGGPPQPKYVARNQASDFAHRTHAVYTTGVQIWIDLQNRGPHTMIPTCRTGAPNM